MRVDQIFTWSGWPSQHFWIHTGWRSRLSSSLVFAKSFFERRRRSCELEVHWDHLASWVKSRLMIVYPILHDRYISCRLPSRLIPEESFESWSIGPECITGQVGQVSSLQWHVVPTDCSPGMLGHPLRPTSIPRAACQTTPKLKSDFISRIRLSWLLHTWWPSPMLHPSHLSSSNTSTTIPRVTTFTEVMIGWWSIDTPAWSNRTPNLNSSSKTLFSSCVVLRAPDLMRSLNSSSSCERTWLIKGFLWFD